MTDLFEKSLSELKLPAYAAELNKAYDVPKPPPLPKLPSVTSDRTQSSALNTAVDLILSKRTKAAAKAGIAPDILVASVPAFNGGADFANLSYEEQSKRYNEFMTTQLTALKAANPKADDLALEDAFKSKNPPPIDPTGGKGDFARGLAQYIPQTKGMLQGAAGLLLKKVGADETGDALLKDAQTSSEEAGKLSLKNDAFTEAGIVPMLYTFGSCNQIQKRADVLVFD